MFLTLVGNMYIEAIDDPETPRRKASNIVSWASVVAKAAALVGMKKQTATLLVNTFKKDGETVLEVDTSNRGKGSDSYIDTARKFSTEMISAIDHFIMDSHATKGKVTLAKIRKHLLDTFPVFNNDKRNISKSSIRYALTQFLGRSWGRALKKKCRSDPRRKDVIRVYLRDYAKALKLQAAGTHKIVYTDESYLHQHHQGDKSWMLTEEAQKLRAGDESPEEETVMSSSKGKRLIMLHAITEDGALVTLDADGRPVEHLYWTKDMPHPISVEEAEATGAFTAENLWVASSSTGGKLGC